MNRYFWNSLVFVLSLLASGTSVAAQSSDGEILLDKLREATSLLNFDAALVIVDGQQAEPYRWSHGNHDGVELEHLSSLNGRVSERVRKNDVVSYFEGNTRPYSVTSESIPSPLPRVLFVKRERLFDSYTVVAGGKSRVTGRTAQLLRVVAKDENRFNYLIWVDDATGILLKSATVNRNGDVLQQVQVTQIQVHTQPSPHLLKLFESTLPEIVVPMAKTRNDLWQLTWLPPGFAVVSRDRHSLPLSRQSADYFLISDGVSEVSIFIQKPIAPNQTPVVIEKGALTLVSDSSRGVDISVIGSVPVYTAEKILKGVAATTRNRATD